MQWVAGPLGGAVLTARGDDHVSHSARLRGSTGRPCPGVSELCPSPRGPACALSRKRQHVVTQRVLARSGPAPPLSAPAPLSPGSFRHPARPLPPALPSRSSSGNNPRFLPPAAPRQPTACGKVRGGFSRMLEGRATGGSLRAGTPPAVPLGSPQGHGERECWLPRGHLESSMSRG